MRYDLDFPKKRDAAATNKLQFRVIQKGAWKFRGAAAWLAESDTGRIKFVNQIFGQKSDC